MSLSVPIALRVLMTLPTRAEALADVLQTYTDLGFRVSSWSPVGMGRTVANHLARVTVQISQAIYNLATSGLLDTSAGSWLTLLAKSEYSLDRTEATYTYGEVKVSVGAADSPITIQPGNMIVRNPATGNRYFSDNNSNVVIGAGSSAYIVFKAESPGDDYNVGVSSITELVSTTFLGTTVVNDGLGPLAGSNEWITVVGADAETDAALRTRCADRWSTLTANLPAAAYRTYAIGASPLITRAYVDADNPSGAGTVNVYLAGPTGEVASNLVASADGVLQTRRALNSIVLTRSATELTCVLTGTVYIADGYNPSAVQLAVETALDDYFALIEIGGDEMSGTSRIWSALIAKAIQAVNGVALAQLTSGDFTIAATQVAIVNYSSLIYTAA